MEDLINIAEKNYLIGKVNSFNKIKSDTETFTYILKTKSEKFIFRKLKNKSQGETEYIITNYIRRK